MGAYYTMCRISYSPSLPQNYTEPERGVFAFEMGDQIVDLAKQSGKLMRGEYSGAHR